MNPGFEKLNPSIILPGSGNPGSLQSIRRMDEGHRGKPETERVGKHLRPSLQACPKAVDQGRIPHPSHPIDKKGVLICHGEFPDGSDFSL